MKLKSLPGRTAGQCSKPDRLIEIDPACLGRKWLLEVLIHEALHACRWRLSERVVQRMGKELSSYLRKLGIDADPRVVHRKLKG